VAVVYSLLVGLFLYKDLKFSELPGIIVKTVQVSAMSIIITGAANVFSFVLSNFRITQQIVPVLMGFVKNLPTYFLVLMLFLFVVGCLLDTVAAIIIIAPIMVPVGLQLGADPLHLGLIFVINLVMGYVTPPFGYNLFTAVSITGLKFEEVVKGSLPFLIVELLCLALLVIFPPLTTWLPGMLGG
jgi:C4-dicarboxylate transporter DctM subunit